jgi:hypothetical protein
MKKRRKIVMVCRTSTGKNLSFRLSDYEFDFLQNLCRANKLTYSEAIFELYL